MPRDPFIREKFTRERSAARKLAREYFDRYPKDRYQTEVESWLNLQSSNIEFVMKRLREPAYSRFKRMEAAWLAVAEEQDWLDGEKSPVGPDKRLKGK